MKWEEFLNKQSDKYWRDTIEEMEANNRDAALSKTFPRDLLFHGHGALRRSYKKGSEKEKAAKALQRAFKSEGKSGYHGASKTKGSDVVRIGDHIIRKKHSNSST